MLRLGETLTGVVVLVRLGEIDRKPAPGELMEQTVVLLEVQS